MVRVELTGCGFDLHFENGVQFRIHLLHGLSGVPVVRSKGRLLEHHGVILGHALGTIWLLESVAGNGYRLVSKDAFEAGNEMRWRTTPPKLTAYEVLKRCEWALNNPLPYDLIHWNCEHLVSWLVDGESKSQQVGHGMFVGGALAVGVFLLAAGRTK